MFYSEPNGTIRNTCLLLTLTQHFLHKAQLSNKPRRIYCLWGKQFLAFDGGQNENDEWLWQFDFWIWTFLTVMMLKFKCKCPSLRREKLARGRNVQKVSWCVTRSLRAITGHQCSWDLESECGHRLSLFSVTPTPKEATDLHFNTFYVILFWVALLDITAGGPTKIGSELSEVNSLFRLMLSLMSLGLSCQDCSCDHWSWSAPWSAAQPQQWRWPTVDIGGAEPDIRLLAAKHQQLSLSPPPPIALLWTALYFCKELVHDIENSIFHLEKLQEMLSKNFSILWYKKLIEWESFLM